MIFRSVPDDPHREITLVSVRIKPEQAPKDNVWTIATLKGVREASIAERQMDVVV